MRLIMIVVTSMYVGAGLFGGLVMQTAVPAMNAFGVAAYAATWPGFLYCARSGVSTCDPFGHIPDPVLALMFDLGDAQ